MSLMLTICTPDALVLSTCSDHLTWLGRDKEGVIGHSCSEWANPDYWDLNWHLFQRSISTGMPMTWDRAVQRLDGGLSRGQVTVKPVRATTRGSLVVLCINRVTTEWKSTNMAVDMARCLTEVTALIPRNMLQQSLEELAADAAALAASQYGQMH